jgi:hypothetical protein
MRLAILNLSESLDNEGFVEFSGMALAVHLARNKPFMNTGPVVAPDPQPELPISTLPLRKNMGPLPRLAGNAAGARRH